jgi:hypothetical protein
MRRYAGNEQERAMISEADLNELRRRLEAAQPGPWFLDDGGEWITADDSRDQGDVVCECPQDSALSRAHWPENAALIVAMHAALPSLIRSIEALQAIAVEGRPEE